MPETMDREAASRWPGWTRIVLIASLAVNLLIVGYVAGSWMRNQDQPRGADQQLAWIIRLAPEERHEFVRAVFDERRDDLRDAWLGLDETHGRIVSAIRADPFLPEALEGALEARRAASDERRGIVHSQLVRMLQAFDSTERILFADELERRIDRWRRRQISQYTN